MSGNAVPQFTRQANIGSANVSAANTNSDGTGNITTPTMYVAFTADATNGSYVESARIYCVGTSAGAASAATCLRLYASNVTAGATTNANTFLIAEITIPSTTVDAAAAASNPFDVALGFRLPAGWTILASTGTVAAANTTWRVTVIGGDY